MPELRRAIARHMTWWFRLLGAFVVLAFVTDVPTLVGMPLVALALIRPPRDGNRAPITVTAPVRGTWTALNSPGTRVPSHGVKAYGQTFAIDVLHPRPPDARTKLPLVGRGLLAPHTFTSWAEPVLAVADGVVVATAANQRDHRSRTSWLAIVYLFIVEGLFRDLGGAPFVLGNHVIVDHGDGVFSAYAHLRRDSLQVATGDRVSAGQQLGEVGNSGNTTEPHLHVQLMDRAVPTSAAGVPFRWSGIEQPKGVTDPSRAGRRGVSEHIEPGLPSNGQVFTVG